MSASRTARKVPDDKLAAAVEAGRARLGTSGRLIVRPSGTEPLMRVMGEGDDAELVERVVDDGLRGAGRCGMTPL